MINKKPLGRVFLACLVGAIALVSVPAKANIVITPTIVLIKPGQRYADLYIVNSTNEPQSYEIGWEYLRMVEGTGSYERANKATTDFDLTQNIVFTPRRVVLPAKGAQKIRLAMRLKGEAPPPGDYRAHILLTNRADRPPVMDEDIAREGQSAISVRMSVGFSVPVIYRVGDEKGAAAKIGNITTEINPKTNRIEAVIPIEKQGVGYGVIGRIDVNYNGDKVGQQGNANIFPEINSRTFRIPLNVQVLSGGSLEVVYNDYFLEKDRPLDRKIVKIAQ